MLSNSLNSPRSNAPKPTSAASCKTSSFAASSAARCSTRRKPSRRDNRGQTMFLSFDRARGPSHCRPLRKEMGIAVETPITAPPHGSGRARSGDLDAVVDQPLDRDRLRPRLRDGANAGSDAGRAHGDRADGAAAQAMGRGGRGLRRREADFLSRPPARRRRA
jgi:hypothetical protein